MTALAWALVLVACIAFEVPQGNQVICLIALTISTFVEWSKS